MDLDPLHDDNSKYNTKSCEVQMLRFLTPNLRKGAPNDLKMTLDTTKSKVPCI